MIVPRETFLDWAETERPYLESFLTGNNYDLPLPMVDQLLRFGAGLREINQIHNLISRKDEENIIRKHICHCLTIPLYFPLLSHVTTVADWGSGGGLPGIPLSILYPHIQFHLIDSMQKKVDSQSEIINYLELPNVHAHRTRIEEFSGISNGMVVVARALSELKNLFDWGRNWFNTGTREIILLKGGDIELEIEQLPGRYRSRIKDISIQPIDCFGHEHIGENKWVIRILLR